MAVTLRLEENVITVGSTTRLHVAAQIQPAEQAGADRVFSWYLDLLNDNGAVASLVHSNLLRPASDNLAQISSPGFADGDHHRGIYDTFMNLPAAGKTSAVELFVIPVTGLQQGRTTLRVRPGSGVPGLASDFIVAPLGGGDPLFGGEYTAASLDLLVIQSNTPPRLSIAFTNTAGTNQVELRFAPPAEFTCEVEYCDRLEEPNTWQPLPGAPHDSGLAVDPHPAPRRFYRVRAVPLF